MDGDLWIGLVVLLSLVCLASLLFFYQPKYFHGVETYTTTNTTSTSTIKPKKKKKKTTSTSATTAPQKTSPPPPTVSAPTLTPLSPEKQLEQEQKDIALTGFVSDATFLQKLKGCGGKKKTACDNDDDVCLDGKCFPTPVGIGDVCDFSRLSCGDKDSGMLCDKISPNDKYGRCLANPAGEGDRCQNNVKCEPGLFCKNKKCVFDTDMCKKNSDCDDHALICWKGACVAREASLGEECARTELTTNQKFMFESLPQPGRKCGKGLNCVQGKCYNNEAPFVGDACYPNNIKCGKKLRCYPRSGWGKCYNHPANKGDPCIKGKNGIHCGKGLKCNVTDGKNFGVCV